MTKRSQSFHPVCRLSARFDHRDPSGLIHFNATIQSYLFYEQIDAFDQINQIKQILSITTFLKVLVVWFLLYLYVIEPTAEKISEYIETIGKRTDSMIKDIRRILIVDDEEESVKTIARHLRREGYKPASAGDGKLARNKIIEAIEQKAPYDLIITDLIMPNMGAVKLLRWLNETCPEVSVIIVSGFGDFDLIQTLIRPEKDGYAQKPLTPGRMMGVIEDLNSMRGYQPMHPIKRHMDGTKTPVSQMK